MRRLLALLLALLPLPLAAQPAVTLSPDSEARWVPFEITSTNHIRFALSVAGRPAVAILDTGVSVSIVTPAFAAVAGMKPTSSSSVEAIGGRGEGRLDRARQPHHRRAHAARRAARDHRASRRHHRRRRRARHADRQRYPRLLRARDRL